MDPFLSVTGSPSGGSGDFWGNVLGGVKDGFNNWWGWQDKKDERKYTAALAQASRPVVFGPPASSASPGSATSTNYQKWGLWVAVAGLGIGLLVILKK